MAEGFANHYGKGWLTAHSAGTNPAGFIMPNTIEAMQEKGIDISGQRSKHLDRFIAERFDRVITLCDKVREVCPEFPGQPTTAHWSMADPATEGYPAFVRTADEIEMRVGLLIAQLAYANHNETSRS